MVLRPFLLLLMAALWCLPAVAAPGPGDDHAEGEVAFKKKKKDEKSKEEKTEEEQRAEEEAERKRKEELARVIVLKWKDTSTDYTNETVMRSVRSRIARPEAMFFPDVDLYQNGRKVPDRTVVPAMQPAIVPDANLPVMLSAIDQVSAIPWNGMTPAEWGLKANELKDLADQVWFIDRVELREPLFLLYAQIGRAAENQNHPSPPFYVQVGNFSVNAYWYYAAQLAYQEPSLTSKITDNELRGGIEFYLGQLQQGAYPSFKLDFEQEDHFYSEIFNGNYTLLINGIETQLDDNGQTDVFLGNTDIYLRRNDTGHGLSERLEVLNFDESVYFVRDVARKKMGVNFIEQLFHNKNECTPEVDGDILNYLAIYQKLHEKADVYIAVPEYGNPNRLWIWRYDREAAQLSLVKGGGDGFPVRFAFLFSSGVLFNGAAVALDDNLEDENSLAPDDVATTSRISPELDPAMVPFDFELRLHYNRLMVNFGAEWGLGVSASSEGWVEYYQTPGKPEARAYEAKGCKTVTLTDTNGDTYDAVQCDELGAVFNERHWNRHLYFGAGVVMGRDAGIGFGPRFAAQMGWTNLPHAIQTTGHFGWAYQPPWPTGGERVRPLIDLDLRGGIAIAMRKSLQLDLAEAREDEARIKPVFGVNLGVGLTF